MTLIMAAAMDARPSTVQLCGAACCYATHKSPDIFTSMSMGSGLQGSQRLRLTSCMVESSSMSACMLPADRQCSGASRGHYTSTTPWVDYAPGRYL